MLISNETAAARPLAPAPRKTLPAAAAITLLTLFSLAVHGYHPYVEDGGLYVAGIRKLLDPALYPAWTEFVTEHLRFSLFAPLVASIVRLTHLPLEYVLFAIYCAGIGATLAATWMLAVRLVLSPAARYGALALMACWLTLPIAGTSLLLMDPYVTARTFSTPLVLAALALALDRSRPGWTLCAVCLLAACALHPLMGGYGIAAVIVLLGAGIEDRKRRTLALCGLGIAAVAAALCLQTLAPAESAAYRQAVQSRAYWFPLAWAWYEQIGLIAPFAILLALARIPHGRHWLTTARAAFALASIATLVAACFSHEPFARHLVARMQPLRCLQIVYELMIVLLGAWCGERILKTHPWRWATSLAALGALMGFGQWNTLPSSGHIEWPWTAPVNPWEQAFLWARNNTPKDALFALDAAYIAHGKHEDAQCFRPIAQRSALADYSKDGGEASITPSLTAAWLLGQQAQDRLEHIPDAERQRRLQPLNVTWIVLETPSPTAWSCPYRNATVKVCHLP